MRACLKLPVFLLDIAIFSACALAQTVENPKLKRLDEEYRKLDGFVSFCGIATKISLLLISPRESMKNALSKSVALNQNR